MRPFPRAAACFVGAGVPDGPFARLRDISRPAHTDIGRLEAQKGRERGEAFPVCSLEIVVLEKQVI